MWGSHSPRLEAVEVGFMNMKAFSHVNIVLSTQNFLARLVESTTQTIAQDCLLA
jgi:hypothetical protein